ncbi:hypothetical protein TNCV_343091 [Trichonephila clavipes]|nr:hypothetical protein TNCV_343091 [Trichonephila clavipes]
MDISLVNAPSPLQTSRGLCGTVDEVKNRSIKNVSDNGSITSFHHEQNYPNAIVNGSTGIVGYMVFVGAQTMDNSTGKYVYMCKLHQFDKVNKGHPALTKGGENLCRLMSL